MAYDYESEDSSEESPKKKPAKKEPKESKRDLTKYERLGFPWWRCALKAKEGEPKPHEILERLYEECYQDQSGRYQAYREYEKLFGSSTGSEADDVFSMLQTGELKQNELANTLETLWAQVFKTDIVPSVCTSESDYCEWFRAKAYGRWLEGSLEEGEVFSEALPKAGMYALVYGTGPIKGIICPYNDTVKIEARAINPKFLMVDRMDGQHGRPRTLFQRDHIDRWQLLEDYEEDEEGCYGDCEERCDSILSATSNDDDDMPSSSVMKCDMLTVKEAWHLPSRPGAGDGRHCIWIKGCTLVYEKWDLPTFPFIFIRFGASLGGFWGESAVKRLAGTQELLDKLNKKIDESQDVMGVPRIVVRRGAGINKAEIDDIPGGILEADDINGIRDWNAQCASPEMYNDRDAAPGKMRSLLGVSDFSVDQQIPQGMRDVSGDMLERWVDQGQARHAMFHKEHQKAVVNLAYLFMDLACLAEDRGYDMVVKAPGTLKSSIETLKFSEVKIDKERMKLRVLPMSQLPQTFAGKVEAVKKLQELIPTMDPRTVARMVEVPDPAGLSDMLVSDEEIIMKNIDFMVKKNAKLTVLPNDNHELILQLVNRFINCYRVKENADDDVVGTLIAYMEDAKSFMDGGLGAPDANAPPAPLDAMGQPIPPPMPPGPPGMPPGPMGAMPPGPPGMPPPGALPPGPPMGASPMGPPGPPAPLPGM